MRLPIFVEIAMEHETELARLVRIAREATGKEIAAVETRKRIDNVHVIYRVELHAGGSKDAGSFGGLV